MANQKIAFTKRKIESLKLPPHGKRVFHYDEIVPGLAILVSGSGTKTFYLVRRIKNSSADRGNTEKIALGKFPHMTVEIARKEALKRLGEIATGKNPAQILRDAKKDLTFKELFDQYIDKYARHHTKSWGDTVENYKRYFGKWSSRKCDSIKRNEVQTWVNKLGETSGHHTANRSLDTLKAVFKWGLKHELIKVESDPCFGIDRFKTKPRERFILPGEEYKRFMDALLQEPDELLRDFFLMCLYTGARKTNVMSMRWQDINLDLKTWRIPDTKNDDAHTVNLVAPALAILSRRQADKAKRHELWVFPSDRRHGNHLVSPKSAWKRILKRAEINDLRIHDIRRTVGSYMAIQGVSPTIIGKALGHRSTQSTAVYARLTQNPVRLALENMQAALEDPERLLDPHQNKRSGSKSKKRA